MITGIFEFRLKKIVLKHSKKLKQLLEINKNHHFNQDLKNNYDYTYRYNTKAKLYSLDFDEVFLELIGQNFAVVTELINKVDFNIDSYKKYSEEYKSIKAHFTNGDAKKFRVSLKRLNDKEDFIFKNNLLKPKLDVSITLLLRYTSLRGRNSYLRKNVYNFFEIKSFYQEYLKRKAHQETRAFKMKLERSKMNASLRYKVLIRDKKTCQICGMGSDDGAILHVDHIIPVAKGGLTTLTNLRTLCDRCNLGKKDQIEPDDE